MNYKTIYLVISCLSTFLIVSCVELTFELPENAKQCFYQEIEKNVSVTIEYQVVTGGQYDIDITLQAPTKEIIYNAVRQQFDSHSFIASTAGAYKVCFSNEFSTFSHKLVYMDFQVGDEFAFPGIEEHVTVMTQLETSVHEIHKNLVRIIEHQTAHRLREATGRKRAEELNDSVFWMSFLETCAILISAIFQVCAVRSFFKERLARYQRA